MSAASSLSARASAERSPISLGNDSDLGFVARNLGRKPKPRKMVDFHLPRASTGNSPMCLLSAGTSTSSAHGTYWFPAPRSRRRQPCAGERHRTRERARAPLPHFGHRPHRLATKSGTSSTKTARDGGNTPSLAPFFGRRAGYEAPLRRSRVLRVSSAADRAFHDCWM